MILRRLLVPSACLGLSFMITVMHSTGQARSQAWQPVQNGSTVSLSQSRMGKARSRCGTSRCRVGYWMVTGLRSVVERVTYMPFKMPSIVRSSLAPSSARLAGGRGRLRRQRRGRCRRVMDEAHAPRLDADGAVDDVAGGRQPGAPKRE